MRLLLVESLAIVIFYVIFLMRYVVIIILEKKKFPVKRKQGVNNCFNPLQGSHSIFSKNSRTVQENFKNILSLFKNTINRSEKQSINHLKTAIIFQFGST